MSEQQAVGKIYAAIPAMIAECEHIAKDKKNQQQGFNYRGIDDVYNAVHPLLAKYKVFPTNEILEDVTSERATKAGGILFHTRLRIRYWFNAEDGSRVASEVIGEGMDSADKSANKAMSVGYKYALFQLLCIPTMSLDPDQESHEIAPRQTARPNGNTPAELALDLPAKTPLADSLRFVGESTKPEIMRISYDRAVNNKEFTSVQRHKLIGAIWDRWRLMFGEDIGLLEELLSIVGGSAAPQWMKDEHLDYIAKLIPKAKAKASEDQSREAFGGEAA